MAAADAGEQVPCPGCGATVLQKAMIPLLGEDGTGIRYLCPTCARQLVDTAQTAPQTAAEPAAETGQTAAETAAETGQTAPQTAAETGQTAAQTAAT